MTGIAKIVSLLIFGAIIVLIVSHPAGAAGDMVAGGSVLDNTLSIESGQGAKGGVSGNVNTNTGALSFS